MDMKEGDIREVNLSELHAIHRTLPTHRIITAGVKQHNSQKSVPRTSDEEEMKSNSILEGVVVESVLAATHIENLLEGEECSTKQVKSIAKTLIKNSSDHESKNLNTQAKGCNIWCRISVTILHICTHYFSSQSCQPRRFANFHLVKRPKQIGTGKWMKHHQLRISTKPTFVHNHVHIIH
eukprot:c340_g1_i1.p1 GENE.c340_g1_i1~~c340_g1_i1.p1  ORF type:complete len:180 (-),score=22.29 c340_g1_i1:285-824(-)